MKLEELPLTILKEFWKGPKDLVSNYDFLKTISVFGGIPRYLEEINPNETPEQNICRLCFNKNGFLLYEFDKIFSDIFSRRGPIYKKIVTQLINGPLSVTEVIDKLKVDKSGSISRYLDDLVNSGFLSEDTIYDLNGKSSKFSKFRIKDNYLRFALNYIEPNKKRILDNNFSFTALESLSLWNTIMGLQFENMILNNKELIIRYLNIDPNSIISSSPYFQRKTTKNKGGCQIDLMITTKNFQIYLIEIKFAVKITSETIEEMKYKLNVLKRPKHYTVHPILVYAGELSPSIMAANLFQLISINDLI
ncbi:MAG: ArsR family transcriptional regulator [Oligoflexia bacterium]|nr:ArsR family transcriptional regulator [Oligoflexia bacterium]